MLASCASQLRLSHLEQDQQLAYYRIIENESKEVDGKELGEVEGYFCLRDPGNLPDGDAEGNREIVRGKTIQKARDDLRLKAAVVGADAVVGEQCTSKGLDLINNCWASSTCTGTALKVEYE